MAQTSRYREPNALEVRGLREVRLIPPYLQAYFSRHSLPGVGRHLSLADVNGDGWLDIVVSVLPNRVCVLINQKASPRFDQPPTTQFVGDIRGDAANSCRTLDGQTDISAMAVGDLNGDKLSDIVLTHPTSPGTVTILLNTSAAAGRPKDFLAQVYAAAKKPSNVVLGDLNGDGRPEIVLANREDPNLSVLSNDGGGGFDPEKVPVKTINVSAQDMQAQLRALTLGDVTGDGRLDIITGYDKLFIVINQLQP